PKRILLALMVLFTVFNALSAFAPDYMTLLLSRLLAGLPHGAFFGVGSVVASRLAEPGKEARAVSMMFAGLTVANLAGVPFGTYIGQQFVWRYSFAVVVLVGLVTLVALYFWIPDISPQRNSSMKQQMQFFRRREAWLIILMIS